MQSYSQPEIRAVCPVTIHRCYGFFSGGFTMELCTAYNFRCNAHGLDKRKHLVWDFENKWLTSPEPERDDPILALALLDLWKEKSLRDDSSDALAIIWLEPGTVYRIDEYDGAERVMRFDDHKWRIAR